MLEAEDEVRYRLSEPWSGRDLLHVVIWKADDLQFCVGDHGDLYDFCATEPETVDEVGRWMRAVLIDGYEEQVGRRLCREYLLAIRLAQGRPIFRTRYAGLVFTIRRRRWRRVRPYAEFLRLAVLRGSAEEFEARLQEVVEASGPVTDLEVVRVSFERSPGAADAIVDLYYDLGDVSAFIMLAAWRGRPTTCRLQFTGEYEIDNVTVEVACAIVAAAAGGRVERVPGSTGIDVVVDGARHRVTKFGFDFSSWEVRAGLSGASG